ncbi:hypothetical protein F0562_015425 [Nyssa sinensis]|uniref:Uncharacterized protein n=1 Tax=Nyssa sinensis TaxID=561372 RepID=A0A5J4ZLC7_9ASTE|nr:hypothetical protein F0562_015425 [Nyssa sinensis]
MKVWKKHRGALKKHDGFIEWKKAYDNTVIDKDQLSLQFHSLRTKSLRLSLSSCYRFSEIFKVILTSVQWISSFL